MVFSRAYLDSLREVQASRSGPNHTGKAVANATAPDLCLAASKYVVGKLLGLFPADSHLNGVILQLGRGPNAIKALECKRAWGGSLSANDEFNKRVLPATYKLSLRAAARLANVEAPAFTYRVAADPAKADALLDGGVPLVVGVGLDGSRRREHFIAIVQDPADKKVWAFDSWEDQEAATPGVYELSGWTSFGRPFVIDMDAGSTRIPSEPCFIGYYIGASTRKPLRIA